MRGRSNQSLLLGVPVGLMFVGLALVAHVSAGGRVVDGRVLLASLATVALAAVLARLRWTFTRLVIAALVSQPLLHVVFGRGADAHPTSHMMMDEGGGHHEMVMMASSHESHITMPLAHSAVAVVTAVAVRWALRWLRSMPDVARALVVAGRGAISTFGAVIEPVTAQDAVAGAPLAVLLTWDTRGPP